MLIVLAIIVLLIYIISPLDILPDIFGPIGRLDDFLLTGFFAYSFMKGKNPLGVIWRLISRMQSAQRMNSQGRGGFMGGGGPKGGNESTKGTLSPWEILEIEPGASEEEIQKAYKRQLSKYHPDRVNHLGKELRDLAHQKTIQIQQAYEALMQSRR